MLNGFQVAGTIRNCSFEAKNQLENILLISEFLWPALLLPVAGSKVCWFRFIAIFFMQGNSFWLFGFYPCLDIQWGRHFKNATWAWKCACHWARASYWCWHSCSDTRSYIFDHLTGITILYLAFFFFSKEMSADIVKTSLGWCCRRQDEGHFGQWTGHGSYKWDMNTRKIQKWWEPMSKSVLWYVPLFTSLFHSITGWLYST